MKIMIYRAYLCVFVLFLLLSCKPAGRTLPSATGSVYECVVVAPDVVYDSVAAQMGADMPCLPQMEPFFTLSHVQKVAFDDFLRSARNILYVDIDSKYVVVSPHFAVNQWSKPQAVCRVNAPDTATFFAWWNDQGELVRDWFVQEELARQGTFLRGATNKEARQHLKKKMSVDMLIPEDYMLIMDTTLNDVNLLWCCNNKGAMRRDLVVYSYPYTASSQFSLDSLNAKRDKVLGRVVTASVSGSYMGTEYSIFPPQMRYVKPLRTSKDTTSAPAFYAAEVRGLWRIMHGEAMGGPYVSLSRLNHSTGKIVTAETFLFAAGQKKRNALRQAEAVLYTLKMDSVWEKE